MSHKKILFFLALMSICIIAIVQLTTLSIHTFVTKPSTTKPNNQLLIPRERLVSYDHSIKFGPRFVNENQIPALGPKHKLKRLNSLNIVEDNQIVQRVDVDGPIYVNANNVVIRDFRSQSVIQSPKSQGMLLEDGVIDGQGSDNDGIRWSDFTARRVEITNVVDGIKAQGDALIEDVWVHDLATQVKDKTDIHNDCVQISSGSNVIINHSRFENCGNNAAIFIKSDQGPIENITIKNNILSSGNYTLQVLSSPAQPTIAPKNIFIRNNLFIPNARYGLFNINVKVNLEDNIDEKGKPINY